MLFSRFRRDSSDPSGLNRHTTMSGHLRRSPSCHRYSFSWLGLHKPLSSPLRSPHRRTRPDGSHRDCPTSRRNSRPNWGPIPYSRAPRPSVHSCRTTFLGRTDRMYRRHLHRCLVVSSHVESAATAASCSWRTRCLRERAGRAQRRERRRGSWQGQPSWCRHDKAPVQMPAVHAVSLAQGIRTARVDTGSRSPAVRDRAPIGPAVTAGRWAPAMRPIRPCAPMWRTKR